MVVAGLIVKNESERLARCLQSLRGAVDRIVVMDTGSTDDTPLIAQRHADLFLRSERFGVDRMPETGWSFAEARNELLGHIEPGCWYLSIDADETLDHIGKNAIEEWCNESKSDCVLLNMTLETEKAKRFNVRCRVPRMFRHDGKRKYVGRLHGVPLPWDARGAHITPETVLLIRNHGRPGDEPKLLRRNLEMLKLEQFERGNNDSVTLQLADNYRAMGHPFYLEAIGCYQTFLAVCKPELQPYVLYSIGICFERVGMCHETIEIAHRILRSQPTYVWAMILLATAYEHMGHNDLAACWITRALELRNPVQMHPAYDVQPDRVVMERKLAEMLGGSV